MDVISKIVDFIGLDRFYDFIVELPTFYLKPLRFYTNFFNKPLKEKISQILVYSLIVIIIGAILLDQMTVREIVQILIAEIAMLFSAILILFTSNYIVYRFHKRHFKIEKVIFFAILVKLLLAPIQLVFFGLFINRENYDYLFIYNFLSVVLYIYVFIFSALVFNTKRFDIAISIILNFLLTNCLYFISEKISIDKFSTFDSEYYTDQILKERLKTGESMSDVYKTPAKKVLIKTKEGNTVFFTFASPIDSISIGSIENNEIFASELKKKIDTLNEKMPLLVFERNKLFFKKLKALYLSIDSLMAQPVVSYTENDIEKRIIYLSNDSEELYRKIILPISNQYNEKAMELLQLQIELESKSSIAILPLKFFNYAYPITYFMKDN